MKLAMRFRRGWRRLLLSERRSELRLMDIGFFMYPEIPAAFVISEIVCFVSCNKEFK